MTPKDSLRPKGTNTIFSLVGFQAGGEGSRTPVIPNLVHGLPHTSRKGLNKGFDECAEVGGFSWKLPLLLPAWPV
jgi:microcystin-dependent protein